MKTGLKFGLILIGVLALVFYIVPVAHLFLPSRPIVELTKVQKHRQDQATKGLVEVLYPDGTKKWIETQNSEKARKEWEKYKSKISKDANK